MTRLLRRAAGVALLLTVGLVAGASAQTVNLGKPAPDAQNLISVNVQAALGALPPSLNCTVAPLPGTGPYTVAFPANPDHSVIEQTVAKVTNYDLIVTSPTPTQPCYTAAVRANGPGGQAVSPSSGPFTLAVSAPGPQGAPGVSRSGTGSRQIPR